MSRLTEKLEEYSEAFDDQFPRMCCMGMSDDEIVKEIDRCLKRGEPFDPYGDDMPKDAVF